jgi:hypothetical protein
MNTWAHDEMMGANVFDARRRASLAVALLGLADNPGTSFSAAVGPAKRQAIRRMFSSEKEGKDHNERIEISDVLAGHSEQTRSRIKTGSSDGLVLMIQDTCQYSFNGLHMATGLGYGTSLRERCVFGHSMLAVTTGGLPVGIAHLNIWARDDADFGKSDERRKVDVKDKESQKWITALQEAEKLLEPDQAVLFIQDREADIFAFMQAPTRETSYLLIRAAQPRKVEVCAGPDGAQSHTGLLFDVACAAPTVGRMRVTIPRAANKPERTCDLLVQSIQVYIQPPKDRKGVTNTPVKAWVVRAKEIDPPEGEKAIEWVLITTMPVTSSEDAYTMVRYYAKRWIIERLHYTIKTGACNAEKLQMDDVYSIKLALALYYVAGWRLLSMTYIARTEPEAPAARIMSPTEIDVLELLARKPVKTVGLAVIEVAKLGGYEYYKNGPPPGVKRLGIGLRRLQDMEAGWLLAKQGRPLPRRLKYDT